MPLLNDPTRGNVGIAPGIFEQQRNKDIQQQLIQLKLREMLANIKQTETETGLLGQPKPPTATEQKETEFDAIIDYAFEAGRIDFPSWLAYKSGAKGKFPLAGLEKGEAEARIAKTKKETAQIGKPRAMTAGDIARQRLAEAQTPQVGIPEPLTPSQEIDKLKLELFRKSPELLRGTVEKAAKPEGLSAKDKTALASTYRKEFNSLSADFRKVRDSYGRVRAAAKDPSAAGDLALIFNYMKILDPGSVVRESEFANAAATGAWGSRMQAAALRIIEGQRLNPEMRADFVDRAEKLYQSQEKIQKNLIKRYSDLAKRHELNPQNVIAEIEQTKPTGLKVGQTIIKNGITYTYQGNGIWEY